MFPPLHLHLRRLLFLLSLAPKAEGLLRSIGHIFTRSREALLRARHAAARMVIFKEGRSACLIIPQLVEIALAVIDEPIGHPAHSCIALVYRRNAVKRIIEVEQAISLYTSIAICTHSNLTSN